MNGKVEKQPFFLPMDLEQLRSLHMCIVVKHSPTFDIGVKLSSASRIVVNAFTLGRKQFVFLMFFISIYLYLYITLFIRCFPSLLFFSY